jgi:hypothetical protein
MAGITDRAYSAACGRLAVQLSVSLAAARRKVDIRAAREGLRDNDAKIALAERMLNEAIESGFDTGAMLDQQLKALASEENFMTED